MRSGALVLLVACGVREVQQPAAAGTWHRTTQSGFYQVEIMFDPPVPPLGQLFSVDAVVRTRDGEPLEVGKLGLGARMPQHNHGMETDPVDLPGECDAGGGSCKHPGGRYRTEGFKFHMPGEWTVTVDVAGPRGPDSTSFVVDVK